MKVNEIAVGFQDEINIGRFALIIKLSECNLDCKYCDSKKVKSSHMNMSVDDLYQKAVHFSRVIITGGEPMMQKEDVNKLCHKLVKNNPDIVVDIETNGTIKPMPSSGNMNNVNYIVSLKLGNTGDSYDHRIVPNSVGWFNSMKSKFKFVIDNKDDVDEVDMLVTEFGIKKHQVFLVPEGKTRDEQVKRLGEVIKFARFNGYNFSPRFNMLWGGENNYTR